MTFRTLKLGPGPSGLFTEAWEDSSGKVFVRRGCFTGSVDDYERLIPKYCTGEMEAAALEYVAKIREAFNMGES